MRGGSQLKGKQYFRSEPMMFASRSELACRLAGHCLLTKVPWGPMKQAEMKSGLGGGGKAVALGSSARPGVANVRARCTERDAK